MSDKRKLTDYLSNSEYFDPSQYSLEELQNILSPTEKEIPGPSPVVPAPSPEQPTAEEPGFLDKVRGYLKDSSPNYFSGKVPEKKSFPVADFLQRMAFSGMQPPTDSSARDLSDSLQKVTSQTALNEALPRPMQPASTSTIELLRRHIPELRQEQRDTIQFQSPQQPEQPQQTPLEPPPEGNIFNRASELYSTMAQPQPQPLSTEPPIVQPEAPIPQIPPVKEEVSAKPQLPSQQNLFSYPSGPDTLNTLDNLREALSLQNQGVLTSNLLRSGDLLASSIARTKPSDPALFSDLAKQAETPVKQFKELAAQEENDPNSTISQRFREFTEQFKIKLPPDMSAKTAKELIPTIYKAYDDQENRANRTKELQLRQEMVKDARDESLKTRMEQRDNADFMKMAEKLSAAKGSSRSAFGKSALNKAAAERIETLISGRSLDDLDVREIQEVARSLDSLLAQGQPTISGTHELVPKTARGSVAKIVEYLGNVRQGAKAGSFLKQMIKTVEREKELAIQQRNQFIREVLPGYSHLEKRDPERYHSLINSLTGVNDNLQPQSDSSLPLITPDIRAGAAAELERRKKGK